MFEKIIGKKDHKNSVIHYINTGTNKIHIQSPYIDQQHQLFLKKKKDIEKIFIEAVKDLETNSSKLSSEFAMLNESINSTPVSSALTPRQSYEINKSKSQDFARLRVIITELANVEASITNCQTSLKSKAQKELALRRSKVAKYLRGVPMKDYIKNSTRTNLDDDNTNCFDAYNDIDAIRRNILNDVLMQGYLTTKFEGDAKNV